MTFPFSGQLPSQAASASLEDSLSKMSAELMAEVKSSSPTPPVEDQPDIEVVFKKVKVIQEPEQEAPSLEEAAAPEAEPQEETTVVVEDSEPPTTMTSSVQFTVTSPTIEVSPSPSPVADDDDKPEPRRRRSRKKPVPVPEVKSPSPVTVEVTSPMSKVPPPVPKKTKGRATSPGVQLIQQKVEKRIDGCS